MIHSNVQSLHDAVARGGSAAIDDLAYTAVFSADAATKAEARKQIHLLARRNGAVASSIYPLYMAIGRGEVRPFTVPAFNIRALTYDSARAVFRVAMRHGVGAFIFEIARSEIGYTDQRPAEYAACVLAAALREGYRGAVFIQGDHFQASAKKWVTPEGKAAETKALESLIDEAIAAEFYNIDIDTSTLVNLDFPTRDEQQRENYLGTAHLTNYIREREPKGMTISVGGEIGEVGKYNTQPDEVRAYMEGIRRHLAPNATGISKISVQTGTSHGGVPLPDGSIAQAKIDFNVLREVTEICRKEYHIAGSVQHGASTLPESVFNKFPESNAVEIHLATGFQNMILDAPTLPAEMKEAIRKFCFENAADERKDGETDEQFVYKTRKKALGPFKKQMWELGDDAKGPIVHDLEAKFEFLMEKLGVFDTKSIVEQYVPASPSELPEYAAASEELTAAATVDPNEGE